MQSALENLLDLFGFALLVLSIVYLLFLHLLIVVGSFKKSLDIVGMLTHTSVTIEMF